MGGINPVMGNSGPEESPEVVMGNTGRLTQFELSGFIASNLSICSSNPISTMENRVT